MQSIVYALVNPAMPGLVKIGVTTRPNVQARMSELYTTGVPLPFECVMAIEVDRERGGEIESSLHAAFAPQRISPSREFFEIEASQVEALLRIIPGNDVTPRFNDEINRPDPSDIEAAREFKGRRALVTEQEFFNSLDDYGRLVFRRIFDMGRRENLRFNWGIKGFSMNELVDGRPAVLCYGFPPNSVYGQTIYTDLRNTLARKSGVPDERISHIREKALETGLFSPAGSGIELRCRLDHAFKEAEIDSVLGWLEDLLWNIRQTGPAPVANEVVG